MIEFAGQAVIVTGAGRGLGRLYALELARRGAGVVVNDVGGSMEGRGSDTSVADEVVKEIELRGGLPSRATTRWPLRKEVRRSCGPLWTGSTGSTRW